MNEMSRASSGGPDNEEAAGGSGAPLAPPSRKRCLPTGSSSRLARVPRTEGALEHSASVHPDFLNYQLPPPPPPPTAAHPLLPLNLPPWGAPASHSAYVNHIQEVWEGVLPQLQYLNDYAQQNYHATPDDPARALTLLAHAQLCSAVRLLTGATPLAEAQWMLAPAVFPALWALGVGSPALQGQLAGRAMYRDWLLNAAAHGEVPLAGVFVGPVAVAGPLAGGGEGEEASSCAGSSGEGAAGEARAGAS
jgi:hypothetical protein